MILFCRIFHLNQRKQRKVEAGQKRQSQKRTLRMKEIIYPSLVDQVWEVVDQVSKRKKGRPKNQLLLQRKRPRQVLIWVPLQSKKERKNIFYPLECDF